MQSDKKVADYMEQLLAYQTCVHNSLVAKQQGEALQDAAKEQAKCMEIARRIAQGAKVPPQDEQRLMRFSPEMYMAAKEAALMNERKSDKEYDSLWEYEDENAPRDVGVEETVDNTEFRAEASAVSIYPQAPYKDRGQSGRAEADCHCPWYGL